MAFLFKSKNRDKHGQQQPRDGPPPGPAGRVVRDEKNSGTRSTPTGSVNSFDEAAGTPSPDVKDYNARRAQQQEPSQAVQQQYQQSPPPSQQTSDLPVSSVQELFAPPILSDGIID